MSYPRFKLSRSHKFFTRTAGSLTLNSTAWADLPTIGTTWDVVLLAQVGDVIEAGISARIDNEAVDGYLDCVTVVSGAVVNHFSSGGASGRGVQGWCGVASTGSTVGGGFMYTVVSGDVPSGIITIRLRYRTSSAANKTLFATADMPFHFFAKNLGPADPN